MITTFFDALIKMSLQGIVMIGIILIVRFVLKKFRINHKYLVGLWLIVFFYLIFPWKINLPIGFWGNISILSNAQTRVDIVSEGNTIEKANDIFKDKSTKELGIGDVFDESIKENDADKRKQEESAGIISNSVIKENSEKKILESLYILLKNIKLSYVWLCVWIGLLANFVCSYFRMKKKLLLSIPYGGKIWWAEEIDAPMVFGLLNPKVYLPFSAKKEDLTYIIVHETMHIQRRDYIMKIFAYMVCLLYWFHPLVWLAYYLFAEDMEQACDEAVVSNLGEEKKKAYAYAILHFVSDGHAKKKMFVAPVCFNEGSIKKRIQNIIKYKPTLPQIGGIVVKLSLVLIILFMTKSEVINTDTEQTENETMQQEKEGLLGDSQNSSYNEETTPKFYATDLSALQLDEDFSLKEYYITNRYTWENHFYIDENGILWGTGTNDYGQLGIEADKYVGKQKEPVKIAEDVISVDASDYGYFCIYLTRNGELYGIGMNYKALLLGKGSEQPWYSSHEGRLIYEDYQKVTQPVLLMQDVVYARAGGTSIVALKKDKTAYWWGEYNKERPQSMYANEPVKVMENCRYITTGCYNGAAINEDGELYTWGWNILGACGTEITEDEFVRTPEKVLEDVKMVWVDGINFNDPYDEEEAANIRRALTYSYNMFALTNNGQMLVAGKDAGNKVRMAEIAIELGIAERYQYSDKFMPIQIVAYTEDIIE